MILGFTYDDRFTVQKAQLSKSYRTLSRKHHPDKVPASATRKDKKAAKEKFVKIAKAYEVLTSESEKMSYDYYSVHHSEYHAAFGSGITMVSAAKSPLFLVIVGLLALLTLATWLQRRGKYNDVRDRVALCAALGMPLEAGGCQEGLDVRETMIDYMDRCDVELANLSAFAKTIVSHTYDDFGNGFRKPRFPDDVFVYMLGYWLLKTLPSSLAFNARWAARRARKEPYDGEERTWLARAAVGSNRWLLLEEGEREECARRGVWEREELDKFNYEQDVKLYGAKKAKLMREREGEEYDDYE
ncbi:hypothetical protein TrRE_jg7335 [Triparma retinervis]|uniref:J domain-containing protein n=1 Tax=Triparma retinervis TaxID=2557542 RepID=A0A9W7DTJ0_9STRA|nr:hypothetical protein TrRE_jg7335 [Triparma retinervis]